MARKLPLVTSDTEAFWTGGASGKLHIHRCAACRVYFHPPAPICPTCGELDPIPTPVSGKGRVLSFTINRQAWTPELAEPYVIAIIELAEQRGLKFLSNVINCPVEDVRIDMPVKVTFEQHEDIWLPLFEMDA